MFPHGLVVYFRMMSSNDQVACSVLEKGRSIRIDRAANTPFIVVLADDESEIGLFSEDFISAILPLGAPNAN